MMKFIGIYSFEVLLDTGAAILSSIDPRSTPQNRSTSSAPPRCLQAVAAASILTHTPPCHNAWAALWDHMQATCSYCFIPHPVFLEPYPPHFATTQQNSNTLSSERNYNREQPQILACLEVTEAKQCTVFRCHNRSTCAAAAAAAAGWGGGGGGGGAAAAAAGVPNQGTAAGAVDGREGNPGVWGAGGRRQMCSGLVETVGDLLLCNSLLRARLAAVD